VAVADDGATGRADGSSIVGIATTIVVLLSRQQHQNDRVVGTIHCDNNNYEADDDVAATRLPRPIAAEGTLSS
jgi:hypothetical protein